MRDSEIEQWVLIEIKLSTNDRLKEVCVFSVSGVVSLKGTVWNRADRLAAQKAAGRAKGVVAIVNYLNVRKKNLRPRRASAKSHVSAPAATLHLPNHDCITSSHVVN